ncbi:MAG: LysR family transcriptional regulator [Eubacterium sp.]
MELRVLQYFLAVTREQSISGAAESLHLSQPTLSRQLKDLEEELGKKLMIRGSRKITLTEEGMLLRKRAEEIFDLVQKTENEISISGDIISGDISIGTGETDGMRLISQIAKKLRSAYPQVCFHIYSGNASYVIEQLDHGLIDFGLIFSPFDHSKYDFVALPPKDNWGVLMRRDSELANKKQLTPEDLFDKPLIISQEEKKHDIIAKWLKCDFENLDIAATYNLIFNASLMVDEGLGYAICLDNIINVSGNSSLCFKPLFPKLELEMKIIWKKYHVFSKASAKFLAFLKDQYAYFH